MKVVRGFRGEYAFLSNFYPCSVRLWGVEYKCAEAAFQAAKAQNVTQRWAFVGLSGAEARRMGRRVPIRPDWEEVKVGIMTQVVRAKFTQNPDLAKKLLATGDALLVEENSWGDTFWGTCQGRGENMLGRILMLVRYELRYGIQRGRS
nr:DUF1768 domain-containing protein [Clostridia bacterium]